MKQFFLTVAGVVVGLLIFFVAVPVALVAWAIGGGPTTPPQTVLLLDLRGGLTDQPSADPLSLFTGSGQSVTELVLTLKAASEDRRVKGLLVRLPEGGMDPAAADELAQAFRRFRAEGKPIIAHSQGLYASGASTSTYALGAAADELWMQPGAPFEAVGLTSEQIFLGRLFRQYGVTAEYEQREDFKNAVNMYLYSDFTPQHREAEISWMSAVLDSTVSSIAADRDMEPATVRVALAAGPYDATGALEANLVDRLGHAEEARQAALDKAGAAAQLLDVLEYYPNAGASPRDAVAVVNIEGAIVTGGSGGDPLLGALAGADDISNAIYDAVDDSQVKAIVLRVSSPGGSDVASEQIAAAVRAAKAAKKPVVVSMGTYAASGGYWISAEADHIVAQPTTITGSIGIYGGKISVGDTAARYGVDMKSVTVGNDYAAISALGERFTEAQRAAYAVQVDKAYGTFLGIVARGRNIPVDRVREIAQGRVWTGVQARRLGLVDSLGGLSEAVDKAKELAEIEGRVRLIFAPQPASAVEALERLLGVNAAGAKGVIAASSLLEDRNAQALLRAAGEERLRSRGARAYMREVF